MKVTKVEGSKFIWLSSRAGLLLIGFLDLVVGLVGLSFLMLDAHERHNILTSLTLDKIESSDSALLDEVGESYQFLLEFWLPSFFLVILGFNLILAAVTKTRCLSLFSFVLSTLFIAGCVAAIISLMISRKLGLIGFSFLSLFTLFQMYFYVIVGTFWMEVESRGRPEDKEMLVIVNDSV